MFPYCHKIIITAVGYTSPVPLGAGGSCWHCGWRAVGSSREVLRALRTCGGVVCLTVGEELPGRFVCVNRGQPSREGRFLVAAVSSVPLRVEKTGRASVLFLIAPPLPVLPPAHVPLVWY